ncbi:MAG: RimK/LysX family protein [Acidobacteriota bacterium]
MRRKKALPVIGWREWVSLPDLGLRRIKAKIDTGARSSALHAINVETFRKRGADWVRFEVHPRQHGGPTIRTEAPIVDMRWVRNPGGRREHRPVIRTPLVLLGQEWDVDVTLTPRWGMNYRMLLGRQTVRHHFLVDPGRSFLGERDEIERRVRHRSDKRKKAKRSKKVGRRRSS